MSTRTKCPLLQRRRIKHNARVLWTKNRIWRHGYNNKGLSFVLDFPSFVFFFFCCYYFIFALPHHGYRMYVSFRRNMKTSCSPDGRKFILSVAYVMCTRLSVATVLCILTFPRHIHSCDWTYFILYILTRDFTWPHIYIRVAR